MAQKTLPERPLVLSIPSEAAEALVGSVADRVLKLLEEETGDASS